MMEYGDRAKLNLIESCKPPIYPLKVLEDIIDKFNAIGTVNPVSPEEIKRGMGRCKEE